MCDVKLCSSELKSLGGTQPHPRGFRNAAVEAQRLKTKLSTLKKKKTRREEKQKNPQMWQRLDSQILPQSLLDYCH